MKMTHEQKLINDRNNRKARKHFGLKYGDGLVLHHVCTDLRHNDIDRYIEWNPEDLVVMTKEDHISLHHKGKQVSEETRKKLSENHADISGKNNPNYGKHLSEETRKKLSIANSGENNPWYGRHHTEETKKKISEANSGENHHMYGKHHTEESRKKMSESRKGTHAGENSYNNRPVYCAELDRTFWGVTEVEQVLGINKSNITQCCKSNGRYHTVGKHPETGEKLHWKYI